MREDAVYLFEKLPEGNGLVGEFIWHGWPLEIPHRRDYGRLAQGVAAGLGLTSWTFDYVHECFDPLCPATRHGEDVFGARWCRDKARTPCPKIARQSPGSPV